VQAVSIAKVPRDRKTKEVLKTRRVVLAPDAQLPGTASWTPDSGADVENPGAGPALATPLADAREGARPDFPSEVQSRGVPAETPGFSPMEELSPVEEGEISGPGVPSETDQERMTDRIFRPGRVNPLSFLPHSPGLRLLQQIRDEAHRFAVTYQRALRSREMGRSRLDDIRGIGPRRKKALLKAFEDIEAICRASVEELAHVAGMNEAAARILWRQLHADEGSE